MNIIKHLKDRALERRIRAFDEFLTLSRKASKGEIKLPENMGCPILRRTRQVEKLNRQIKKMNGL